MSRWFFVAAAIVGATSLVTLTLQKRGEIAEKHVNANLVRVHVGGHWVDVPMMPLAAETCQIRNPLFDPYCP